MKVFITKKKLVNEFAKELRTNTVRICQVKCLTMWQNFVAYVLI